MRSLKRHVVEEDAPGPHWILPRSDTYAPDSRTLTDQGDSDLYVVNELPRSKLRGIKRA